MDANTDLKAKCDALANTFGFARFEQWHKASVAIQRLVVERENAVRKEHAAALEAARAEKWQPIETVPRGDHNPVLAWCEWYPRPLVCYFGEKDGCAYRMHDGLHIDPQPTLWQPLPTTPKDTQI